MSDFVSSGWSLYVAALTVIGLAACLLLLMIAARRKVMASDNTTGHVWDEDLRELNNPLPRWWMGLFVLTVAFAAVYLLLYPGLGAYAGRKGWTQQAQHQAEVDAAQARKAPLYARFAAMEPAALARDPQARGLGERLFVQHCAQCHGSDARGSKGFPDLTDRDWLHGGEPAQIAQSIRDGRQGVMPPMAAAVGGATEVRQLAHYVLSLSGGPHDNLAAQLGRSRFTACAGCHGARGEGNPALGAPRLNDDVWLHGWGEQAVVKIVNEGRLNQMPAHGDRLSDDQVRVLAAYVWGLSNAPRALAVAP